MLINILVYLLPLLVFFLFDDNNLRNLFSLLSYFISCEIYKVDIYKKIIYLILASICVFTEYIFINLFDNTWSYKMNNFIGIPLWLIPLWGIAILLIININKDIDKIINFIKKIL
jgi:hypothetical protein